MKIHIFCIKVNAKTNAKWGITVILIKKYVEIVIIVAKNVLILVLTSAKVVQKIIHNFLMDIALINALSEHLVLIIIVNVMILV